MRTPEVQSASCAFLEPLSQQLYSRAEFLVGAQMESCQPQASSGGLDATARTEWSQGPDSSIIMSPQDK
ncbi:hypothetical protein EYF80_001757 [Liparis tanakae]|uniref:Uncharacterized protein n=1 Tax=Liparis tanakae TaxID=230148 RepID=A0A4Z2JDG3_9TELE|nr:hypothetical protein EYF80_001757 [Liparis tanakae]